MRTNAGRQVSKAYEEVVTGWGGTDIVAGMNDIEAAFRSSGVSGGPHTPQWYPSCITMYIRSSPYLGASLSSSVNSIPRTIAACHILHSNANR